jgi:hypothetical protein
MRIYLHRNKFMFGFLLIKEYPGLCPVGSHWMQIISVGYLLWVVGILSVGFRPSDTIGTAYNPIESLPGFVGIRLKGLLDLGSCNGVIFTKTLEIFIDNDIYVLKYLGKNLASLVDISRLLYDYVISYKLILLD